MTPENKYGKYFLSFEAPGDEENPEETPVEGEDNATDTVEPEVEEKPEPKNLRKIIIKSNKRSYDFGKVVDQEDSEETEPLAPEEDPYALPEDQANNIAPTGDGEINQPVNNTPDINGGIDPNMPNMMGQDIASPVDNADMNGEVPEPTADGISAPAATGDQAQVIDGNLPEGETPPTPEEQGLSVDDVDFTDDQSAGGEDGEVGADMPAGGEEAPAGGNGPGIEYDSTRKYILFKNFIALINAINTYITKLNSKVNDNIEETQLIKSAVSRLTETKDQLNDFVMMRFELSSYIQSKIFFQEAYARVEAIFDMISKVGKVVAKDTKK